MLRSPFRHRGGSVPLALPAGPVLSALLFVFFFTSGFCGLAYQVVWLRIAFAHFGVITPVLSVVVSVFMLGLSLGTWLGGRSIETVLRRSGRSAIEVYAGIELAIGVGAFAVPSLFAWGARLVRPAGDMDSAAYLALSGGVIALALLPWCLCMGATFPVMSAFLRERTRHHQTGFSFLYLANVIGAMVGVLLTAMVLIEAWWFSRTLLFAGGLNLTVAAVALGLGQLPRAHASPDPALHEASSGVRAPSMRTPALFTVLFVTGLTSMAMEVVWARTFTPILHTTVYAFASLLAVYLLATWVGTLAYRVALHLDRSGGAFGLISLCGALALLPLVIPDPNSTPSKTAALVSIFPFCAALGYLTPKLIDEYSAGSPGSLGRAYGFNILGSILGPLLAGYFLLPSVGAKASLLALAVPYPMVLLLSRASLRSVSAWAGAAASVALFIHAALRRANDRPPRRSSSAWAWARPCARCVRGEVM